MVALGCVAPCIHEIRFRVRFAAPRCFFSKKFVEIDAELCDLVFHEDDAGRPERRDRLGHANIAHDLFYSRRPEGGDPGVSQSICSEIFPPLGKEQVHSLLRVARGQFDFRQPEVLSQLIKRGF